MITKTLFFLVFVVFGFLYRLMGLKDEFAQGRDWVEKNVDYSKNTRKVSVHFACQNIPLKSPRLMLDVLVCLCVF